jgi:2OG-Fe(II) oxygenase superfamily
MINFSFSRRNSKEINHGAICRFCTVLSILLVGSGFGCGGVQGFIIVAVSLNRHSSATAIFALTNGKNKMKQRNPKIGGGFGQPSVQKSTATTTTTTMDEDYRIFPSLEARVRDTLVAATDENYTESIGNISRPISAEIYQRLDQIYGFPSFNYDKNITNSNTIPGKSRTEVLSPLDFLMINDQSDNNLYGEVDTNATTISSSTNDSDGLTFHLQQIPPFKNINILHVDPMVLSIDNFFTLDDCDRYINQSETNSYGTVVQSRSPTVGKDANAKSQRTSTTFYHRYEHVPELISKASRLLGLSSIDRWEEPQTVRYRRNEKFTWHLDALGPLEQQSSSSGQRTATLLVYLTNLTTEDGGATLFRDLGSGTHDKYLRVQPRKGMALLFFPSAGGIDNCPFDIRTLHCGEVISKDAACDKWIAQLWLRQHNYAPTAPPGNRQSDAYSAIYEYCYHYEE